MPHDQMIADGRPHRMPCPAPGHPGDRSAKSVAYRWDGHNLPMLKCWSGDCPYRDIAKGLGLSFDRPRRNDLSRFIVGRYEHEDPGEPDRLAYRRDFPIDFEGHSTCPYRVDGGMCGKTFRHKHVWSSRGRRQGTKVLLWGEDKPGNIMVVVEGEKAAASLTEMANEDGTPFEGYTPVTFYGGGSSAALANWDAIEGRDVLIWPDNDEAGHDAADKVFDTIAGNVRSARKVEIEVLERELPDKADAFDLATDAERIACLHEVRGVYKTSTRVAPNITRAQRLEHGVPIPEGKGLLPSLTDKELHVALWWLWLYGEGRIVGQEHVSGDKDLAHIYDVSDTGLLVPRVDELTNDLIGVGAVYRERIATSTDSEIQGAFRSMLGFARDLADLSKPLLIKRGLVPESFIELKKQGITPKARVVDYREIDEERRYLGAPNGIIDLETGKLLTGGAHADKLVSHTIQDCYDPKAGDERVEKLTAHLSADDERWLWSALGASLWGSGVSAEGGLYFLRGPSKGGKTTLLESVVAALGRPYGTMVPGGFLERDEAGRSRRGSANPDPFELDGPRFACQSEWTKGMSLAGVAKNVASGDIYQGARKLYEGYKDYPPHFTPNIWIACNPDDTPPVDWEDDAWQRRIRFLAYPALPERQRDPEMRRAKSDPKFRQALMAKLVHYASETQGHIPTDTRSITELQAELRDARLGVAGVWLQRHIRTFGAGQAFADDKMTAQVLWDTMVAAAQRDGEHNEKGPKPTCWGWDRSRVMRDVRKMHNLPTQKPVRGTDGKKGTGWRGVLLMECGDTCAACEARPEESAGDINPASTPPVLYIAKQSGAGTEDAPWEYFPTDIPAFRYVIKDDGEKEWVLTPVPTELEGEAIIVPGTLDENGAWVPLREAVETLQDVADLAGGGDFCRDGDFASFDIGPRMTYHVYWGPVGMWHKAREFGLNPGKDCAECSEAVRRSHAPFKDQGALDGMPAPTREKH